MLYSSYLSNDDRHYLMRSCTGWVLAPSEELLETETWNNDKLHCGISNIHVTIKLIPVAEYKNGGSIHAAVIKTKLF